MALISSAVVGTNRTELTIEVSGETYAKALEKSVKKNVKQITIPGFRKGKAPRHMIEKMYGKGVFYEDAVNEVYPAAYEEAVKESGITPVDAADITIDEVTDELVRFKAGVTTKPVPELGEYKGLSAVKHANEVTEEDVDKQVGYVREQYARLVPVEGRNTQKGDTATIDFEGFVDGTAFEGGKGEDYALELGSGTFIPGFEEQVEGHAVDDEFDVNVTFPEDYQEASLAGKPAVFKCKLKGIKVKELPELDDDFAKDISDFETFADYRADLKANMQKHNDEHAQMHFENDLIAKVVDGMKVDIPECMIKAAVDDHLNDYGMRLSQQGLSLDDFVRYTGQTREALAESFRPQAINQVKARLALEKIAELEKLEVSEDELNERFEDMAKQYKLTAEQIKNYIPVEEVRGDMLCKKAMDVITANAVAEAEPVEEPKTEDKADEAEKPAKKTAAKKTTTRKTAAKKTAEKAEEKVEEKTEE